MRVLERLVLLLIGATAGCALTLLILGLPSLFSRTETATGYVVAASVAGFVGLGIALGYSAYQRERNR